MAASDTWRVISRASPRRRAAAAALVAAVIALHALVTWFVLQGLAEFERRSAMPPRIQVSYVRELELAPPPAVVAPPRRAPARAAPRPLQAPQAASAPAAPEPEPDAEPAATESLAEAEPAPEAAPPEAAPPDAAPTLAEAAPPDAPPFDWPVSTRLTYTLRGNYRGELHGDAQVEWVRVGSRYQVHIDVGLGPLISRRMSSEGELSGDRLLPSRYDEETRLPLRQSKRTTILFEADEVVLANGERRERAPEVQDSASQFIQLAAMFTTQPELLREGGTVDVLLALRNRIGSWTYDILGEEEIATPFGPVATYHLRPRNVVSRGTELSAEVWFAPQLRYLPVRMQIRRDEQTFVDLVLARRPEIAAQ